MSGGQQSNNTTPVVTTHIWLGDEIAFDITASDVVKYLHGIKLIESDFGLYLYDAHGNVTGILDSNYDISQSYTYDPFGADIVSAAESEIRDPEEMQSFIPDAGIMSSGIQIGYTPENPYRYCGEYTDTKTGYVYLRARYYDPTIGRFISEDSAKDGYNWYVYCGNDPINYVDPSGNFVLTAMLIAIGIGALTGAIIGAGVDIASQLTLGGATLATIDWASVGASAISGAITGAVGAATGGVGTLGAAMTMGALGGLSYYGAYSAITDQQITIRGAATAAVSGAISGAVGYGISKLFGNLVERPSWRQSEIDVGEMYPEYEAQKSFLNGQEVPYGTKGSSRPDYYKPGSSIEVKNYDLSTGSKRNSMIRTISNQINKRVTNLPMGTSQTVVIDVRGQNVTIDVLRQIREQILKNVGTAVKIKFMR